jgi:hypothetical protein
MKTINCPLFMTIWQNWRVSAYWAGVKPNVNVVIVYLGRSKKMDPRQLMEGKRALAIQQELRRQELRRQEARRQAGLFRPPSKRKPGLTQQEKDMIAVNPEDPTWAMSPERIREVGLDAIAREVAKQRATSRESELRARVQAQVQYPQTLRFGPFRAGGAPETVVFLEPEASPILHPPPLPPYLPLPPAPLLPGPKPKRPRTSPYKKKYLECVEKRTNTKTKLRKCTGKLTRCKKKLKKRTKKLKKLKKKTKTRKARTK